MASNINAPSFTAQAPGSSAMTQGVLTRPIVVLGLLERTCKYSFRAFMNNLNASKRIRKTVIRIILTKCVPHKSEDYPRLLQGPGDDDGFSPRAEKGVSLRDNA